MSKTNRVKGCVFSWLLTVMILFWAPTQLFGQGLRLDEVALEAAITLKKINSLFGSSISLRLIEKDPFGEGSDFTGRGFESLDEHNGEIFIVREGLEDFLENWGHVLDRNAVAFVTSHEAAHVLLGHARDRSIMGNLNMLRLYMTARLLSPFNGGRNIFSDALEEDADQLAAKIMKNLGLPIDSALALNLAQGNLRDPERRNRLIVESYEEGWANFQNWNFSGPPRRSLLTDKFDSHSPVRSRMARGNRLTACRMIVMILRR